MLHCLRFVKYRFVRYISRSVRYRYSQETFCLSPVELELIQLISQHRVIIRDFNSDNRNTAWVSKWDEYQNYWVVINAFWIRLYFSDLDMWGIDLSDTDIDLLDTDIHSKHFVCLQDFFKACPQDVLKTSSA